MSFDTQPEGGSTLPGELDLLGSVAPPGSQSLDQMFGLGGASSSARSHADPLADFLKKTEPEAVADAAVGAPSSVDPLALLGTHEPIVDEPSREPTQARSALPDDVPEINAAMSLPPVVETRSAPAAPVSVSASDKEASPFADLGLAAPLASVGGSGLLDDLDLSPQTVPSVHAVRHNPVSVPDPAEALVNLTVPLSITPVVESVQTITAIRPARPSVGAPSPSSVPEPGPAETPVGKQADTQALWAAFCEGAGVRFAPPQGLNPDLMRVIGQLLHHAVDGSLKLVAARAATKQEMRAEVTVIQARSNNPLKFSPDTESALEQMLQPPLRGFMSGPDAVADAMDDLLGHTIGTMVGMRAALEGVLARFEPEQLESKLVGRSMMDSLLPMNRRAKLWELYLQHYGTVRTEAQDDFHNLFGRAFLQAYEDQLDRLDAERRQRGHAQPKPGASA